MDKKFALCLAIIVIMLGCMSFYFYTLVEANDSKVIERKPVAVGEIKDTKMVYNGWIEADAIKIKSKPSKNSKSIGTLKFNEQVSYTVYNDNWFEIKHNGKPAYISAKNIAEHEAKSDIYYAPNTSGFKSYMDYRTITCTGSKQYALQSIATTSENGIRTVDGRYCVAVGSHYTSEIGQYFDLVLANGTVIPCVLGDQKADIHTDADNIVTAHNGCMSEFVVDAGALSSEVKSRGNISYCNSDYDSPVMKVIVYDKNAFDE